MTAIARFSDLEAASVFITGGATGIGAALTRGFLQQGARVTFIDMAAREGEALSRKLESETGNRPVFVHGDVTDATVVSRAVDRTGHQQGPITVLVNNAARDDRHRLGEVDTAAWDANHAINLRHQFFTAQAAAEQMKAAGGGSIVNFTSTGFMMNVGDYPVYAAAKAGVIGLTKSLAGALGPYNIRVNALAPGWVMTERQRALWVQEGDVEAHVARQCIRREMHPDDVVAPCLFLASQASAMMTAQTMIVDGGIL